MPVSFAGYVQEDSMFIFVPPSVPLPRPKAIPPAPAARVAYLRGIPVAVWIKALGRRRPPAGQLLTTPTPEYERPAA